MTMKLSSACAVALLCLLMVGSVVTASAQTWTPLVNAPPVSVGAMLLLTDGRVLVHEEPNCSGTGCVGTDYSAWYTLTPDSTGSYINGTWTKVASLPSGYEPLFFSSAVLADGKVAIQGGEYNCPSGNCTGDWQSGAAIYDPAANTWTSISPEVPASWQADGDAQSVVLPNGTWMTAACCAKYAGDTTYADYFYFNESSLNFTSEASASDGETTEFDESGWNLMPNGEVLMVNVYLGSYSGTAKGYAIYNPSSNTWTEYTSTAVQLWDSDCGKSSSNASYELGPVMLMPNGTFFATGASDCEAGNLATYNWSTNTWTAQGTFPGKNAANDAPGATEINGNAIVMTSPYTSTFSSPATFYEWNGTTLSTFPNPANAPNDASYLGHLLVLPTGQIMFTDFTTGVEILTSAGTYQSAWQPTISSAPYALTAGQTYSISGTQFNGVSTGAAYGDDFQDNTNYPLVRIVNNSTGSIYYAKTHGHSTMGVATGSTAVSTNFDVPANMPSGACELYVVANGIPSASSACNVGSSTTATTTSLQSSGNPSAYGQTVAFTATVTPDNSPQATGTVQFTANGAAIAGCSAVALSGAGLAQCSTAVLPVGTNSIEAIYSGDSNYGGSTSIAFSQGVNQATAATVVTSSLSPSTSGESVTFTATISGEYGQVKGSVSRRAKQQAISGTVAWSSNTGCGTTNVTNGNPGVATCTTSSLGVGTDTITATYSGDSNHSGSSGTLSGGQAVDQATTSTSIASSLNPSSYGQAVSFTASVEAVAPGAGTPSGTVQFSIDGSAFGSAVTLASGTATSGSISTLTDGTHTVTAVYNGNTNFATSADTLSGGQVVNQAAASTVVASSLNPSTYGQPVTFTATITGENGQVKGRASGRAAKPPAVTGTVAWSSNTGCGTTNVTSGNPGVATCTTSSLGVGTDTITATYSGDSNHSGGSGTLSGGQVVNQATTSTTVASSLNPSIYGQAVSFTASVAAVAPGAGTPTGTVQFSIDGSAFGSAVTLASGTATSGSISTLAQGTHTVTAVYSGGTNFATGSGTLSGGQGVSQASAATVVTSSLSPSTYLQSVTFTATINGEYGLVKGRTAGVKQKDVSGTVAWSANTGCGTTNVTSGNPGTATCATTSLAGGTDTVTATYSGDSNHGGSSGTFSQTVNQASQTITFTTPPPVSANDGSKFTVAASATSGLAVTFGNSGSCSNSGATYTMTSGTGTCSVIVNQTGNNNYAAAPTLTATVNAGTIAQTITFTTPAPATAKSGDSFTVAATGGASGNPVTFSIGAGSVCSLAGATYTMTSSTGYCYVVANQAGNGNYSAASPVTETVTAVKTVTKVAPTVTFTGAPTNAAYLSTFTVSTTQNSGVTPKITSATGTVCSVSGDVVTMKKGEGTCTVKATWATNDYYLATSLEQSTTATLLGTTTTITNTIANAEHPLQVEVYYTASNGTSTALAGDVTVTAASGQTCTGSVAAGKCLLKFTAVGSTTLTATYAGNTNDATSTSAEYPLTVN